MYSVELIVKDEKKKGGGGGLRRSMAKYLTQSQIGTFVCIYVNGVRDSWSVDASLAGGTHRKMIALCAKISAVQPEFRNIKDLHFNTEMRDVRVHNPKRRNCVQIIKVIAIVLLTLLDEEGKALAMDSSSTSPTEPSLGSDSACDFIMARLYEVGQEIFENTPNGINLSQGKGGKPSTATYRSTGLVANYFVGGRSLHIITLSLDKTRISNSDSDEGHFLSRLEVAQSDSMPSPIRVQCDMLQADIYFKNHGLEKIEITQSID